MYRGLPALFGGLFDSLIVRRQPLGGAPGALVILPERAGEGLETRR